MRVIVALVLGLMAISSSANAQSAAAKDIDEGTICVGGSSGWLPSFNESRAIAIVPVPDSYRRMFESTEPCVKWRMGVEGIVDWHLGFGSTATVLAALGYIEQNNHPSVPPPAAYLQTLRAAFLSATPDLKRATAIKQPPGVSNSVIHSFMERSKAVSRLNELLRAREEYVFFARHYLRAAEEFTDSALLAKAEVYISIAKTTADFLAPLEDKPPIRGLVYFNLDPSETDDLHARAALLRARISGSTADLDEADRILKTLEQPSDVRLADLIYSGGDDLCDITNGVSGSDEIEAACRSDDDIEQRLPNLIINRAHYEAIAAGMGGKEAVTAWPSWTARAERLLAFEALPDRGLCCGRSVSEDKLRLLRTRAHYAARLAAKSFNSTTNFETNVEHQKARRNALALLSKALELAPPYAAPARFTQIAQQWLSLWNAGQAAVAGADERPARMQDAESQRFAAYLVAILNGLAEQREGPR